jgi:hypothetical protein
MRVYDIALMLLRATAALEFVRGGIDFVVNLLRTLLLVPVMLRFTDNSFARTELTSFLG